MANGVGAVGQLVGKVNASNALVVSGDTGAATGGSVTPVLNVQGKVDSSNRLVLKFV